MSCRGYSHSSAMEPSEGSSPLRAAATCPQLSAEVPDDLTKRRVHTSEDMGTPASVGVIWSNTTATRVVNISSAPTDEQFGDGTSAAPKKRMVQGAAASEVILEDVHKVSWQHPHVTGACEYWAVVAQGLTPQELDIVLKTATQR